MDSCSCKNMVYCTTCTECNYQNVGITTRPVRIKEHIYHINKNDITNYLFEHFRDSCVNNRNIEVTTLDNMSENIVK